MLEEKDLQSLAALMDAKLSKQSEEIMQSVDAKMNHQRGEIMRGVGVLIENEVSPKFALLSEGIDAIDSKLITRSEFDALKEEVAFLKDIIRMHTNQINDLKKAQ